MKSSSLRWLIALVYLLDFPSPRAATVGDEIHLKDALVLARAGRGGRTAVHTDALEHRIVLDQWETPFEGDRISTPDGKELIWEKSSADENGELRHSAFRGGYCLWKVSVKASGVWLLKASGHNLVYVNGTLRAGDPYRYGFVHLPVWLKQGDNELLFSVSRGRLKARLDPHEESVLLDTADATLPDLLDSDTEPNYASLLAVNASTNSLNNIRLRVNGNNIRPEDLYADAVLPLSARKIGFRFTPRDTSKSGKQDLLVELSGMQGEQAVRAEQNYNLNVKGPSENRKVTFLSHIDRSVQYYALNPARGNPSPTKRRALVLSVHGAGVQAMNQANAYSGKSWTHLVAATNRRPFGFDWEDWGRLDAMEVLAHSSRLLEFDPQRVYLTGHSMGGHGTWQLGAHFPDRFAAIGPSAGWISFSTYGRSSRSTVVAASAMDQLLERSRNASNTLLLSTNYTQQAIYIIHGTADRSVPVREARTMRDHLAGFHNHVMYHEQPDAGHWWGNSDEPGSECVDWPPMFDLFSRTRIPLAEEVRKINFTTVNPGLSSRCHWAEIFAQDQSMEPSNISLQWDPWKGRVFGTTQNVTELGLTVPLRFAETPITIELDGQTLTNRVDLASKHDPVLERKTSSSSEMRLIRTAENWGFATHEVVQRRKSPERSGSFKAAFTNSVILVYGTQGTENENQWSLAKARFDSETFWYRGNGSLETMSDLQYVDSLREGESDSGIRNVILYGNEDTNLAFSKLLETCPIKIKRGRIQIGDRELVGDQLGALLLWPNLESSKALVGVVGGTGITGLKMTDRLPYFVSGVAYPDWIVVEPDVLMEGNDAIVGAGFFDTDWLLSERDTVWK